jgi:hypothetical protein
MKKNAYEVLKRETEGMVPSVKYRLCWRDNIKMDLI